MSQLYRTVVVDEEYHTIGTIVKNYCNVLDGIIVEYQTCLSNLNASGVVSGKTQEAISEFISYVYRLKNILPNIGEKFSYICRDFLSSIDSADGYLYECSSDGNIVRDFTQDEYENLLDLLDNSHESSNILLKGFDYFSDKVIAFCIKWLGWYDVKKEVGTALENTQKALMDYNNDSKKFLKNVFNAVLCIDRKYGETIQGCTGSYENFQSSSPYLVSGTLSSVNSIILKLSEIINPSHALYSSAEIRTQLEPLFERLNYYTSETLLVKTSGDEVAVETLRRFCENYLNENFYYSYTGPVRDLIAQIGFSDIATIAWFQKQSIVMDMLTKRFSIPGDVEKTDYYAYLVTKRQLSETVCKMADTEVTVPFEDSASKAKEIISAIREHKESYPGYSDYKKMYDKVEAVLKNISKVIGKSVDGTEIMLKIFEDYSKNISVLHSIESSVDAKSLTGIAVRELQEEYNAKYLNCFKELVEYTYSETAKTGVKELEKTFTKKLVEEFVGKKAAEGAGGLLSIVETTSDVVGDLLGLTIKSQAQSDLSILYSQTSDLQRAYVKAFESVKNGDTSNEAILSLKNSFELLKRNTIKEYELAMDIAGSKKNYDMKAYYQYCKQTILDADLNSVELPRLMSFDQYKRYGM